MVYVDARTIATLRNARLPKQLPGELLIPETEKTIKEAI